MNPYVLTGLAMCLVVLISLGATAYLAVFFNRRAKADLEDALKPLAEEIDGSIQLDDAQVTGKCHGYPVYARMANATEGPGRVFQVDVIDSAGGSSWRYTSNPASKSETARTVEFVGDSELRAHVEPDINSGITVILDPEIERFRIEYLADKGLVRFVRSMQTRRNIPGAESFGHQLDLTTAVAMANRNWMETRGDSSAEVGKTRQP